MNPIVIDYFKRLHVPEKEWDQEFVWYEKRSAKEGKPLICLLETGVSALEELVNDGCITMCWMTP